MTEILSLILLFCAGFCLQFLLYGVGIGGITAMLCTIIFMAFGLIVNREKHPAAGYLPLLFSAAAIFVPELRPYLGVSLLCIKDRRDYLPALPGLIALGLFFAQNSHFASLALFFSAGTGLLISFLLISQRDMQQQLIVLRDTSREQQLVVEEKNKALRDNQDTSIHLATLQERNRIAREIHDNVGHMLTRSILQTGAVKTINKDPVLAPLIDGLQETLTTAMNNIRESVHDLHDESVDLAASLRDILDTASDFETQLQIDPDLQLPKKLKYGFIAIVKEAVSNSIKHSTGNRILVSVREHPGFYQLKISDNGKNPEMHPENGIGLSNIEDRVREMNGTVSIHCSDGFGILVTVMKDLRRS